MKAYFAYLDLGGSGIETHSHLSTSKYRNITVCFQAFQVNILYVTQFYLFTFFKGSPNIVRFFGTGVSIEPGEPGWDRVLDEFAPTIVDGYICRGENVIEVRIFFFFPIHTSPFRSS